MTILSKVTANNRQQVIYHQKGENLMKPKLLFILSTIWIILIGVTGAFLSYTGTYDIEVAEPALLDARFRVPISLYFGLAVINWFARNAEASRVRNAIFLGNTVGFIVWAVFVALVTLTPGSDPTPRSSFGKAKF
jgi:hypothetical protein